VTENFFSLLICVREKGRERGAPASWLWFSTAASEREREHQRGLGWAPASSPTKSRAGSLRNLDIFSGWVSASSLALVLCRQREKGGARRWLGWTPASSPASYRLGYWISLIRGEDAIFFNKGILVILHSKTMSFWIFHPFSQFQLTEGGIRILSSP
jgi:hypothetical protein